MNMSTSQIQSHKRVPAGYTLIEVLIVVVILGIAAAVVAPATSQAGVLRIQAAVRSLVADITFAQMDALGYQEQRAIYFDVDNNQYTLVQVNGSTIDVDNDALYDPRGPGQRFIVDLNDEVFGGTVIESVDIDGDNILIFDEMGGPVATPGSSTLSEGGSITLAGPMSRFRVDIAAFTGRVTVIQLD